MSLQLMKERIKQSGSTLYDEQIKDAKDILAYDFQHDVSCAKHMFYWIPGENPRKGNHVYVKLYDRKYSSANGNMQQFLTEHTDKIEVGDYLYNESDDTYWICTESFNVNNVHYEGKLTQCNWYLRWQRPDGIILEYPCLDLNSTQYNSGETGNSTVTLGSAQHMEKVQATPDTIALASPQRFYVSRNNTVPYVITQNDTTANFYGKGICSITVTQDVNREGRDRPDLGICDYIEPSTLIPPTPSEPDKTTDLTATISGNNELKVGFSRTYTVTFADEKTSSTIDWNDVDFSWNVDAAFDIKQSVSNNQITISVDDESLIGSSFILQCIVDEVVVGQIVIEIMEVG